MEYIGNIGPKFDINLFYLDLNHKKIAEEILANNTIKLDNNPESSFYEDSFLPLTPNSECKKLILYLKSFFKDQYVLAEYWSHIHKPLESTNTHSHGKGMSFVYYAKVPKNSGKLIIDFNLNLGGPRIPIQPIENSLLLFPSWIPHLVTKNLSLDTRISISGNLHKL